MRMFFRHCALFVASSSSIPSIFRSSFTQSSHLLLGLPGFPLPTVNVILFLTYPSSLFTICPIQAFLLIVLKAKEINLCHTTPFSAKMVIYFVDSHLFFPFLIQQHFNHVLGHGDSYYYYYYYFHYYCYYAWPLFQFSQFQVFIEMCSDLDIENQRISYFRRK